MARRIDPETGKTLRYREETGTWIEDDEEELPILHTGMRLSNVRTGRGIDWLWRGRIPLGCVTLLGGDPGVGKTLVALELAALLTASSGGFWPDQEQMTGGVYLRGVVLFSAEDTASTLARRLKAAGGNLDKCSIVRDIKDWGLRGQEYWRRITFDDDYSLRSAIREINAALVVFDPFTAFLGPKRRVESERDMRTLIQYLNEVAAETRSSIVLIHHLGKGSRRNVLTRASDATRTLAAARASLLVMPAPGGAADERLLVVTKSNLGETPPAMRFRITTPYALWWREQETLREKLKKEGREDEWIGSWYKETYPNDSCVEWLGEEEGTPNPLAPTAIPVPLTAQEEAVAFLRELLGAGPTPATEVGSAAYAQGITPKVLRRARERLGVRIERQGFGQGSRSMWRLPDSPSIHRPQPEEIEESEEMEERDEETEEEEMGDTEAAEDERDED